MKRRRALFNFSRLQQYQDSVSREWHLKTSLKINCGINYHQTGTHYSTSLSHSSLLRFVHQHRCSESAVVHFLWPAWALPLSSMRLLNDSNYFPQLQATHACFISTSTFPICLYSHPLHRRCPSPILEGRNPAGVSVLPGRQDFHLGAHFPLCQRFLPGRTENPDLDTCALQNIRKKKKKEIWTQNNKAYYASFYIVRSFFWFPDFSSFTEGPGLLRHLRGVCRDWWMLLCSIYDSLDVD